MASAPATAPPLPELLSGDVATACAGLVGCVIARRLPGADGTQRILRARIVEAEAYHQCEPGCHAFRGRTPRNAVMFGPPGSLYVYFTYGMWHCANVVCEAEGTAAAVLLRAAALLPAAQGAAGAHDGAADTPPPRLSGPGLLCRGLELTREHSGLSVLGYNDDGLPHSSAGAPAAVWLYRPPQWEPPHLTWTTRIGFSFPDRRLWRCYATGDPAVSPGRPGAVRKLKRRG